MLKCVKKKEKWFIDDIYSKEVSDTQTLLINENLENNFFFKKMKKNPSASVWAPMML